MRSSLFVGAMVAARYNPQLKNFRDKLVAAGKSKLIALVAVARGVLQTHRKGVQFELTNRVDKLRER